MSGRPDQPQSGASQEALQQSPQASPAPALTPLDKSVSRKIDEKAALYEEKARNLTNVSNLSGSIGESRLAVLTASHINRIRLAAQRKKDEYLAMRADSRDQRAALMIENQTEKTLADIHFPFQKLIEHVSKTGRLDETELVKLQALMETTSHLPTNPQLQALFTKALKHEHLELNEIQLLADQTKLVEINLDLDKKDLSKLFESSQAGAVIALLPPDQRLELAQAILQTKPPEEARKILEIFITAKIISNLQLQDLLSKNKVSEPLASDLKAQLANGDLSRLQELYQQRINQLAAQNKGSTATNPALKFVGSPLGAAVVGVFSMLTLLANLKIDLTGDKSLSEKLKIALTNPISGAAALLAAGSGMVAAKISSPETYTRYVNKFRDFWADGNELKARELGKKEELQAFTEDELTKKPSLLEFLLTEDLSQNGTKSTGLEVVKNYVNAKKAKKEPIDFSYQEILSRCGPRQKELFQGAYAESRNSEDSLKDSLRAVMASLIALGHNTPEKYQAFALALKKKQGLIP